ncbi:MAG: hypothetical protein V7646_5437 [Pseudonocardia sp.]|jgi:hypothetical protein
MASGASGLPPYTMAPTVKTSRNAPVPSTASFRLVSWEAAIIVV